MSFTEDELNEFKIEAHELLDSAEKSLLALDKGEAFPAHYNVIFRAFHSIKGAASMMSMTTLQGHVHHLETVLTEQQNAVQLERPYIELFLKGCDSARNILEGRADASDLELVAPPAAEEYAAPVAIPITAPVAFAPVEPVAAQATPLVDASKPRDKVLVLDDEYELVELASSILEHAGFEVLGTTESVKIKEHLATFRPDIVLTDIKMPKVDGLGVLSAANDFDPDLPVIFLSGHVTKDILMESIGIGVYGVLEKPVDSARLVEICHQAARKSHLTRMLNRSLKLLMYQFSDLDDFLKKQGKNDIRRTIQNEIDALLVQRRELRAIKKNAA